MFKIYWILAFCNLGAPDQIPSAENVSIVVTDVDRRLVLEVFFERSTPRVDHVEVIRPRAVFYRTPDNPREVTLTAEEGRYYQAQNFLVLSRGARLVTDDGNELVTDSVRVNTDTRAVETEDRFTLTRPQMRVEGVGIRGAQQLRTIEILHEVTAFLTDATTGLPTGELYAPNGMTIVEETIGDQPISVVEIPDGAQMVRRTPEGTTTMTSDWARITLQRTPDAQPTPRRLEARGHVVIDDPEGSHAEGDDLLWSSDDNVAVLTGAPVTVHQGARTITARAASFDNDTGSARFDGEASVRIEEPEAQPVTVTADTIEAAFKRVEGQDPTLVGVMARSAVESVLNFGEMQVRAPEIWISGDQSTARVDDVRSARFVRDDGTAYDIMGIGSMDFTGSSVVLEGDIAMASEAEHIRARRIAIVLNEDRSLRHMDAEGDVRFARPGEVDIACDRMVYDPTNSQATVYGDPHARITRGDVELLLGETTVNLNNNDMSGTTPGGRSRLRFRPPQP